MNLKTYEKRKPLAIKILDKIQPDKISSHKEFVNRQNLIGSIVKILNNEKM